MRSVTVAVLLSAGILIAGCGGGGARAIRNKRPATTTTPAGATAATSPSTPAGIRSLATVEGCLASNHIPVMPYTPPAGAEATPSSGPHLLLVMPWAAVQITVYSAPVASSSSITTMDAGAVMSSGNVSLALAQIPEPPPTTMSTIETCAFGRPA